MNPRNILVVEDNPISLRTNCVALQSAGYAVLEAADGQQALESMGRVTPDLILQTMGLPDIDAFELVRRLRAMPGGLDLPILAITGFLSRVEEGRALEAGFTNFLLKPVEPSRLIRTVAEILGPGVADQNRCLEGARLLLVDDDPVQLKLYSLRLRAEGCQVRTASDGMAALDRISDERPDLVLSDVLMPRMDGFRLCDAIRRDPTLAQVPVVLHSSHFLYDADRELGAHAGAAAYLSRTGGYPELIATLRRVLDARSVGQLAHAGDRLPADEYLHRMVRQLERQVESNARLVDRSSSQAAALALLSGFPEALVRSGDIGQSLGVVLAQGLDAAGLSRGCLYFVEGQGGLGLGAAIGFRTSPGSSGPERHFGHPDLLDRIVRAREPVTVSRNLPADLGQLLSDMAASSALLLPLMRGGVALGLLVMVADRQDLAGDEWTAFSRLVAAHLGQSLALGTAYEKLAASERRLRALLDGANDAVVVLTTAGVITEANPRAREILARPLEELVGRHVEQFSASPADADNARAQFDGMLPQGHVRVRDVRIARPSGEVREVDLSASVVPTDQGEAVLAIATDVTAIREQERYRDVTHAATRVLSASGRLDVLMPGLLDELVKALRWDAAVYWQLNDSGEAEWLATTTGFDAMAPHLAAFLRSGSPLEHGMARDVLDSGRAILLSGEQLADAGARCVEARTDGLKAVLGIPVIAAGQPIGLLKLFRRSSAAPDGHLIETLTAVGDKIGQVLRRRRSEEELQASEERFRKLTASLPQVFWMASPDLSRILYVSPAYEEVWGLSCRSLYERPDTWTSAIVPEDRAAARAALLSNQDCTVEYRIARPDGTRLIRDQIRVVKDASGVVIRRSGVAEDITAMHELEERYRQSQKMEAFGQLAGGVAHDFNNLLSVILGHGDLLLDGLPADDPMRGGLESMKRAAKRAESLTRQLLTFSRKQLLQPRVLELNTVVTDVQQMLRRLIGEDVELVFHPASRRLAVLADPGQLQQVLLNLVLNARDAMPRGGTITIETDVSGRPEGGWLLRVRDTGHGMTPEVRSRIFEPFFTTKEPGRGTGLGLATVMGIVEQSGASIEVESEPGAGATFTVYLPEHTGPAAQSEPAATGPEAGAAVAQKRTVLIVEDEPDVASLAEAILVRQGYAVLLARDGQHAIAIARGHAGPIDLVLTDVVMPRVSGAEVAAQFRELRHGVPVLFMSGYMDDTMLRYGIQVEGIPLLQKPFSPASLASAVGRAIAEAPAAGPPAPPAPRAGPAGAHANGGRLH